MYSFLNDYNEVAHPRILQALVDTNLEQTDAYGMDYHSQNAANHIRAAFGCSEADVHFLAGGTQTNLVAIAAFLRPHEAVISADCGHIHTHEAGSIEATGHKILAVPSPDGKLRVEDIEKVLATTEEDTAPRPKLVYISNTTELGTAYSREEMAALGAFCRSRGLILFVDGARMGSALCCKGQTLTMEDYPKCTDAFYIGGTKNGAMIGEALVIVKDSLKEDFRRHLKQRGAVLAKGRVLGIQFEELFRDGLFLEIARHMNTMSDRLRAGIAALGYPFLSQSPSNQLFPILPNTVLEQLQQNYDFAVWEKVDEGHTAIRLVAAWATREEMVDQFLADLKKLS